MKKFFLRSFGILAAAAVFITGCSTEAPAAVAEENGSERQGGVSETLGEIKETEIFDTEIKQEKTDTESEREKSDTEKSEGNKSEEAAQTTVSESAETTAGTVEIEAPPVQTDAETEDITVSTSPFSEAAKAETQTAAQTTAESSSATEARSTGTLDVSVSIPATWQENGRYCGTCEFTVSNGGGKGIENWTVKIKVPDGFNVTASWNGKFDLSGGTLTVVNESYNGNIPSGGSAGFGFNFSSPDELKPPYDVTVNGNAVKTENGSNANGNEQSADASAAEAAAPLPAPALAGLVKEHGKLSVNGTQLVDKNGNNFQLKGMSTHGISWFPDFVNKDAFKTLRDDWNTNVIRLAMYTAEYGGYCSGGSQADLKALIDKGVQAATDLGMYVIIDWHILSDGNPQTNKTEALKFFEEMSFKYRNYENVIYEICNEPNGGVSWENDIKPYAEEVIAVIRKNAPDSVVIVGTPTWSQDIDKAAANPLSEKNVLYALHFYAATHTDWLRQRLTDCYNKGLPVFVSEFGTCDASGNGANDFGQTKQWLDLLDKYGISYVNWNLANKNETSSAFKESASANGNWGAGELSEGGAWIRKRFRGEN